MHRPRRRTPLPPSPHALAASPNDRLAAPTGVLRGHVYGGDGCRGSRVGSSAATDPAPSRPRGLVHNDIPHGSTRGSCRLSVAEASLRPFRGVTRPAAGQRLRLQRKHPRSPQLSRGPWPSKPDGRPTVIHRSDDSNPPPPRKGSRYGPMVTVTTTKNDETRVHLLYSEVRRTIPGGGIYFSLSLLWGGIRTKKLLAFCLGTRPNARKVVYIFWAD